MDPVKNFVKVTVSTGYTNSSTSIVLTTGHGARLLDPAVYGAYNMVWWDSKNYPDPADDPNTEIIRVIAKSSDTITILRAQENTTASTKNTSDGTYIMIEAFTKKLYDELAPNKYLLSTTNLSAGSLVNIYTSGSTCCVRAASAAISGNYADGYVTIPITAGNSVPVFMDGIISSGLSNLSGGFIYFLNPAVAGGITYTCPTTAGQTVQIVGKALSSTELLFKPSTAIILG